jgi:hypothetical protein
MSVFSSHSGPSFHPCLIRVHIATFVEEEVISIVWASYIVAHLGLRFHD